MLITDSFLDSIILDNAIKRGEFSFLIQVLHLKPLDNLQNLPTVNNKVSITVLSSDSLTIRQWAPRNTRTLYFGTLCLWSWCFPIIISGIFLIHLELIGVVYFCSFPASLKMKTLVCLPCLWCQCLIILRLVIILHLLWLAIMMLMPVGDLFMMMMQCYLA